MQKSNKELMKVLNIFNYRSLNRNKITIVYTPICLQKKKKFWAYICLYRTLHIDS